MKSILINTHGKIVCGLLLCALLFSDVTQAQHSIEHAPGFYGEVALSAAYNDNILRSKNNEVDDQLFMLAPNIGHRHLFSKHSLDVGYQGRYAFYSENDKENVDHHTLASVLALDFTEKLDVNLEGSYQWLYEARGATGVNLAILEKPNEWERSRLFAEAIYGHRTNQGQLAFSAESTELQFINNNQQARDRNQIKLSGTFYYNMTGETSWLFETRLTDIDYTNLAVVNRDSQEQNYFVGVRWEASHLISSEIRAGYVNKDFDQAGLNNFEGGVIEAEVLWTPLAADRIALAVNRAPRESAENTASYYISTRVAVSWNHTLTSLWSFLVSAHMQDDNYSNERNDDLFFASLGMNYSVSERLNLTGKYNHYQRDSNTDEAVYESNQFMITLTLQPGVNKTPGNF